jgi:hypothetical protein
MKKPPVVVLVCGLGSLAGCGSDNGAKPDAKPDAAVDTRADVPVDSGAGTVVDAGLLAAPVLDPRGTYGGKTYPEWLAAWWKHFMELPDATGVIADTTGAYCSVGQSVAPADGGTGTDVFFLGGFATGKYTLKCTIPSGEMIFVPLSALFWDNSGVPEGTLTDEQLKANLRAGLASVTGLSLEIDGVSYGSKVADFAAYVIEPTQFSYTVPDTPTNFAAASGGGPYFTGTVPKSFCAGHEVLLAPLAAGPHTIHTVLVAGSTFDVTYNVTIGDISTLGPIDGGPSVDAAPPVSYCTGPASSALIDDMSGPHISLMPPSCGSPGNWTAWSAASGVLTTPAGDTSILSNCGSLCQSLYSPLPAGFPGTTASVDAGPVDARTADGGSSGMQAMCIAGQSSTKQYDWSGMNLTFAYSGTPAGSTGPTKVVSASGAVTTDPPPALIDASQYSGIEFWLWASPDTVAAMSAAFVVQLVDKNQLPGGGVCDPNATSGKRPCSGATAGISFSSAASQGAGLLLGADGFELTSLAPGWQLVRAPWGSFLANPYYGGGNEKSVDPKTLAFAQFVIEQNSTSGGAIPFDFCVHGLRFYK